MANRRMGKSNDLWRYLMLAASLEAADTHGRGAFAVVALEDDRGARDAVAIVGGHLSDRKRLLSASLQDLVDAADSLPGLAEWSIAFRLRYLS